MIINHITDNDLYKFTMQYAVVSLFPLSKVRYKFINRGADNFPDGFAARLQEGERVCRDWLRPPYSDLFD
jgi:nicotinate phosphoribosyltransferase